MYDKCFENKSKNILENRKSVNPFCVSGLEGVCIYIYIYPLNVVKFLNGGVGTSSPPDSYLSKLICVWVQRMLNPRVLGLTPR
jgi:hypothetical protein